MNKWLRLLRDIYLLQLLRREGCADASSILCPHCQNPERSPRYQYQECAGGILLCKECCVDKHTEHTLCMLSS
jgi:hypothetical protein